MEDLLKLLSIQSETGETEAMFQFLSVIGFQNGWRVLRDEVANLYFIKGESQTYPCVVAHMDTVHRITEGGIVPIVIDGKITGINPVTMRQTGIGGDDKCGIWAALHCMHALPACKAVFFVDEERGCKGSRAADLNFFKDCRYILQADRHGNSDFVTDIAGGPLSSKEFIDAIDPIATSFGYSGSGGMMTDVMQLRDDKVGISVANMSAGYHNPHSDSEYIVIMELLNVCKMMEAIFRQVTDVFPYVYERKVWTPAASAATDSSRSGYDPFPEWSGSKSKTEWSDLGYQRCAYCNALTKTDNLMEIDPHPVCIDCALHKEEHGVYPVNQQSSFWKKLAGNNGDQILSRWRGKRKKKGRNKFRFKKPGKFPPEAVPVVLPSEIPPEHTLNGVSE